MLFVIGGKWEGEDKTDFADELKLQEYSDQISELEAELAATRDKVSNINLTPK